MRPTGFVDEHPGGEEVMLDVGGQDSTEAFEDVGHSDEAREILEGLLVGTVKRGVSLSKSNSSLRNPSGNSMLTTVREPAQRPSRQTSADHHFLAEHRQRQPVRHGRRPLRHDPDRWRPGLLRLPVHAAEPAEGIEKMNFLVLQVKNKSRPLYACKAEH